MTYTKEQVLGYLRGRELRAVLMERYEGKCFWCDREVVEYSELYDKDQTEELPDDAATIDHLQDFKRGSKERDPTGKHKVLACYRCNKDRGDRVSKKINSIVKQRLENMKPNLIPKANSVAKKKPKKTREVIQYC